MSTGEPSQDATFSEDTLKIADAEQGSASWPHLDGYEILALLGRGGMGRVFKARHQALGRIVAVKFLLSDADEGMLTRFRSESQAVAQLHHPHIAQVFETSQVDGQPYFAMEYVDGGSLAQFLAGKPQAPYDAAALAETLARAMHHSHQQGILHRDLKPGNILLSFGRDPEGSANDAPASTDAKRLADATPKITDFGLAKRLQEGSRLTRTGEVLGTPSYMAPEQASGVVTQLGPGVDVYALGAILYEVLTGRPPFQAPDAVQTLMMLLTMDPVPPRRLQPKVPRDLETICLKCLEKSPRRRYATALELAEDLRRFRDHRPILARPAGPTERAFKWARRNRAWACVIVLALLSLVALVAGYIELQESNRKLVHAIHETEQAMAQTEESVTIARAAIDRMLVRLSAQLAPLPHSEKIRRESLEDAQKLYEKVTAVRPRDVKSRDNVAESLVQLGKIYRELGMLADAEKAYRKAKPLYESLRREFPDERHYLLALLGLANNLGNVEYQQHGPDDAEPLVRAALDEIGPLLKDTDDPMVLKIASTLHDSLAVMLRRVARLSPAQKLAAAEKEQRAALELRERWHALKPDDAEARSDLATSRSNLATVLMGRSQAAEAVDHLNAAIKLLGQPTAPGRRYNLASVLGNLAVSYELLELSDQAIKAHANALAAMEALVADYSSVPDYRYILGREHVNLGRYLYLQGKNDMALHHLRLALPILRKLTRDHAKNSSYRTDLTICQHCIEVTEEAQREAKKKLGVP